MKLRAITAAAALAAAAVAPMAANAMDAENAVKYRQQVMKAIGGHTNTVVMILKGEVPYSDQLLPSAQMLADTADLALLPFEENTAESGVKTTATADVWTNWDKFSGGIKMMQERTDTLVAAVESGDKGAIGEAMQAVGETCKNCHDNFREK
ncbi:cytochrome c, class II [Caenispirillum salinarum AK4]|uniref:Cytochrome c, class II n=1 Tax=Caenispirillum salinarum AK4 TaxID=1238182 RepID=K9GRF7_9PROT|nr:cytochrome c [Caenispirillum salinarum]EKV28550.1 cytochrome c, class II [Caenispirillum salinarum AK4]